MIDKKLMALSWISAAIIDALWYKCFSVLNTNSGENPRGIFFVILTAPYLVFPNGAALLQQFVRSSRKIICILECVSAVTAIVLFASAANEQRKRDNAPPERRALIIPEETAAAREDREAGVIIDALGAKPHDEVLIQALSQRLVVAGRRCDTSPTNDRMLRAIAAYDSWAVASQLVANACKDLQPTWTNDVIDGSIDYFLLHPESFDSQTQREMKQRSRVLFDRVSTSLKSAPVKPP